MRLRVNGRALAVVFVALVAMLSLPLVFPTGTASAAGPCDLSSAVAPEIVGGGVDGLVKAPPPDTGDTGAATGAAVGAGSAQGTAPARQTPLTNYDRYGMAGQYWHTYDLGCSDVTAVLGNAWANTIFSWAKAVDRLTISTYQAAASEGPLQPIKDVADDIVRNLAEAMYWPYLRPIIILGAIWLAWYGLIRKRATTTTEGVVWMVVAVTVAVWFFSRPGDFTGIGKTVTDKTGEVVNSAFAGLPGAEGTSCLPAKGAAASATETTAGFGQPGTPGVAQNADALWSTLVCRPWLMGEFGTADASAPVVRTFGAKLLDIQAIDADEQSVQQMPSGDSHQKRFEEEIAKPLQNTPMFFLFQGKDWTSRLGIAIGAFIAAMVAGVLIFLVAVSLLVLKVGFLLLLILGPIFLLIGVHPGSGRIIAMRWVEMLIGTLLRQAVLALVLGVLVYGYALIMSTTMPWGMQIMFMALLTIAVFFYRRPFQHLFSSMNGHTLTTRMLGEAASAPTLSRAANALPPVAAARIGRWGLRKAEPIVGAAVTGGASTAAVAAASLAQGRVRGEEGGGVALPAGAKAGAPPVPLDTDPQSAGRRKAGGLMPRPGSAPPLNLNGARSGNPVRSTPARMLPARATPGFGASGSAGGSGSAGATGGGAGLAGAGGRTGSGRTGSGSAAAGTRGGWFSGSSGGWASRPSSAGRSGGSGSMGSRGGGAGWGGSGGRSSSSSSSGGGGGSGGRGLFGGRSGSDGSAGRSSLLPPRDPEPPTGRSRSSEPPPLWLPSRRGGGGREPGEAPAPFWARPANRDGE